MQNQVKTKRETTEQFLHKSSELHTLEVCHMAAGQDLLLTVNLTHFISAGITAESLSHNKLNRQVHVL